MEEIGVTWSDRLDSELSSLNLKFLVLAQRMIASDVEIAGLKLGLSKEACHLIAALSFDQIEALSRSGTSIFGLRQAETSFWETACAPKSDRRISQLHNAILSLE